LSIAANIKTYEVGAATANASYVQEGATVIVSWAGASTNDPSASFAKNGTPTITFGGNAIEVTPTTTGFSFTVPSVSLNSSYTLSIPANAFGYAAGSTYNEAQNIVFNTPLIADGTYYLRVASTFDGTSTGTSNAVGKYLARGNNNGTHTTVDLYGLPIQVVTDGDNKSTLSPADTKRFFYHASSWDSWADRVTADDNVAKFDITLHDGVYRIHNVAQTAGTYLKYNTGDVNKDIINVFDDGNGTNSGPIINWTFETPAQHATVMASLKNSVAATAATAAATANATLYGSLAGITTVADLETAVSALPAAAEVVKASAITSVSEKYQGSQPGSGNTGEIVYSGNIDIYTPGLYRFAIQGFYRAANNEITTALHTANTDFPPVVAFLGNAKTQLKSLFDEVGQDEATVTTGSLADVSYNDKYYANSTSAALVMLKDGKYENIVWAYISEPGTYKYGVMYQGYANSNAQWFIYSPQSVSLTSYVSELAGSTEYAALNAAIDTYDKIGFEKDEYAVYNNYASIKILNDAKAINQSNKNGKAEVEAITAALTGATWVINTEEMNAVYDGTFAAATNDGAPAGWTMSNNTLGGSMHSRAFVGDDRLSEFNSSKSGFFMRFDGTNSTRGSMYYYGQTSGYTMPLKANTAYRLTADFTNWGTDNEKPLQLNITGPNSFSTSQELNSTKDAAVGSDTPDKFDILFKTTDAGNYEISFQCPGSDDNKHNVLVSNIILKKPAPEAITITDANYATYVSDNALDYSNVTGLKAYKATVDEKTITLSTVTTVPAGEGVLIKANSGSYDIPVTTGVSAWAAEDNAFIRGTGAAVASEADGKYNFILNKVSDVVGFYKANGQTVATNRAYIQTSVPAARLSMTFDDKTTGIKALDIENKTINNNGIYDLQGRRIAQPVKGMYIQNGKKVIVK
jgi:hypothetical protein